MAPYTAVVEPQIANLTVEDLLLAVQKADPTADLGLIREAYQFAEEAHRGQLRSTGEPYIQHPLHVAYSIAKLRLGSTATIAALLHDIREDTAPKYHDQISPRFGEAVNFLVSGVTKLSKVRKLRENQGSIEDLRTIFLAMTKDIRVIIIKLADRLHNLQTLAGLDAARRERIARQTLDIYAPIADRLGMGEIRGQLEDLAFVQAMPDKARWVRSLVKDAYIERVRYCDRLRLQVKDELAHHAIPVADIHGRAKRLYSLYLKLERYGNDINQIYDLVALRVIVPDTESCYRALGVIHRRWKPLVGKIKDYVATPKANGYQSLHTTVIVDQGRFMEIQIRSAAMHDRAERGVAASWAYADAKRKGGTELTAALANDHDISWVKQLARWQQEVDNPEEFFQTLRSDFFKHRIFCLTPKGEVINLPEGASPVDFAYSIHSNLGNRAIGARVNSIRRPLDHQLGNGDVVEIELSEHEQAPRREWLDFVKTNAARKAIKHWYNQLDRQKSATVGQHLLAKELNQILGRKLESIHEAEVRDYLQQQGYRGMEELFVAVGRGERNPRQVVKRVFAEDALGTRPVTHQQLNVRVPTSPGQVAMRARCCRPIEGDAIVAVRHGTRLLVHRTECRTLSVLPEGTLLTAHWIVDPTRTYRVWVQIAVNTYTGMLRDIADVCAQNNFAIHDISVRRFDGGVSGINVLIEIRDADQLSTLIRKLRSLPHVTDVIRRHA